MAKQPVKRGANQKRVEGKLSIKTPKPEQTKEEWPIDAGNLSSDASPIAVEMSAPTEATIREIRNRIEDGFKALGTDQLPGTVIPAGSRNNSKEAADYLVADLLSKLAKKRKDAAEQAAEKAGVFGDPKDYIEGDTVMVFNDPNFSISMKMGTQGEMLDRELVEEAAEKHFGKKAAEFLEECKKPRAASKQIIVSMK
jgi:hypothetical protein